MSESGPTRKPPWPTGGSAYWGAPAAPALAGGAEFDPLLKLYHLPA
jgi:hypothetical protein